MATPTAILSAWINRDAGYEEAVFTASLCRNFLFPLTSQKMGISIFNELELELQLVQAENEAYGARLVAGHLIGHFPLLHAYFGDVRTFGRLTAAVGALPTRPAAVGAVRGLTSEGPPRPFNFSQDPRALAEFEFRRAPELRLKKLRSCFDIAVSGQSVTVGHRDFVPRELLDFPVGASHVSVVVGIGILSDFEWSAAHRGYLPCSPDFGQELLYPLVPQPIDQPFDGSALQKLQLPAHFAKVGPASRSRLLLGLGLIYFRTLHGRRLPLHTHNNCVLVFPESVD
jgi:hypothetical protein